MQRNIESKEITDNIDEIAATLSITKLELECRTYYKEVEQFTIDIEPTEYQ